MASRSSGWRNRQPRPDLERSADPVRPGLVERVQGGFEGLVTRLRDEVRVEHRPEHRRDLDEGADIAREWLELGGQGVPDDGRHRFPVVRGTRVHRRVPVQRIDEERVAAGRVEQRRTPSRTRVGEERSDLVAPEPAELEAAHGEAGGGRHVGTGARQQPRRLRPRPVAEQQHEARRRWTPSQRGDHVERLVVGPVHVVESQEYRPAGGQVGHRPTHHLAPPAQARRLAGGAEQDVDVVGRHPQVAAEAAGRP